MEFNEAALLQSELDMSEHRFNELNRHLAFLHSDVAINTMAALIELEERRIKLLENTIRQLKSNT